MKYKYIAQTKEWFDKINGNSYFSVQIEDIEKDITYKLPFQYGYGDQSEYEVKKVLGLKGFNSELPVKFIKITDCKKRDVESFGKGDPDNYISRLGYYYCD